MTAGARLGTWPSSPTADINRPARTRSSGWRAAQAASWLTARPGRRMHDLAQAYRAHREDPPTDLEPGLARADRILSWLYRRVVMRNAGGDALLDGTVTAPAAAGTGPGRPCSAPLVPGQRRTAAGRRRSSTRCQVRPGPFRSRLPQCIRWPDPLTSGTKRSWWATGPTSTPCPRTCTRRTTSRKWPI